MISALFYNCACIANAYVFPLAATGGECFMYFVIFCAIAAYLGSMKKRCPRCGFNAPRNKWTAGRCPGCGSYEK